MRELARACIAGGMLTLAASTLPAYLLLAGSPPQMSLTDRVSMAQADLLARPCFDDTDCWRRIAVHGLDPLYYEGPDEWLESGCLAKGDRTACAYLAAWGGDQAGCAMSLIHNERTKLTANALDRASTACLTVGVLGPGAAALYGVGGPAARGWIMAGALLWLATAAMLHFMARRTLGSLK